MKLTERGYVVVSVPGHPRARKVGVFEHILVVEAAIGKYLPLRNVVHHIDGNKTRAADERRKRRSYTRFGGKELPGDLQVLSWPCHAAVENTKGGTPLWKRAQ